MVFCLAFWHPFVMQQFCGVLTDWNASQLGCCKPCEMLVVLGLKKMGTILFLFLLLLRNGSHAMDTKEQMMTQKIGSWRFQQMQVTSLSSILLETNILWYESFMKLMTFTAIHRRAGILAFQTSSFQLIKKDLYYNHFFFRSIWRSICQENGSQEGKGCQEWISATQEHCTKQEDC